MSGAVTAPPAAWPGPAATIGVKIGVGVMIGVALLQLVVLVQVTALRDRVVQLEAGAEFQDYAQGCRLPEGRGPALTLPGSGAGSGARLEPEWAPEFGAAPVLRSGAGLDV